MRSPLITYPYHSIMKNLKEQAAGQNKQSLKSQLEALGNVSQPAGITVAGGTDVAVDELAFTHYCTSGVVVSDLVG